MQKEIRRVKKIEEFNIKSPESGRILKIKDFFEKFKIRSDSEAKVDFYIEDRYRGNCGDEDWILQYSITKHPLFTNSPSVQIEGRVALHWYWHWHDFKFVNAGEPGVDFLNVEYEQYTILRWISYINSDKKEIVEIEIEPGNDIYSYIECIVRDFLYKKINLFVKNAITDFVSFINNN